jgi:hypothetical protein
VVAQRERDCAELNEVVRGLPRRLAIQGHEMKVLDQGFRRRSLGGPGIDGIVERGEWLGSRRTEAR